MNTIKLIIFIFLFILLTIFLPWAAFVILCAVFFISTVTDILHVVTGSIPEVKYKKKSPKNEPFVTIHIACHAEPPEILKHTLNSLANLDYKNYEVIIIDNGTRERQYWEPVRDYCKMLGKKFRFYHANNIPGFKAGALNYIKNKSNQKAEFKMVLDADYKARKDMISEALSYFSDKEIAFVQFPQSYFNVFPKNRAVAVEYWHFFGSYMNMANLWRCVSLTGTVFIYRIDVLKKVGGFDEKCISEDAELGFRINKLGYRGIFVSDRLAQGLMPYDLASYKKQKRRWSSGNAQVLRKDFKTVFTNAKHLSIMQKIGFYSQLTAWINFLLLPIITLLTVSFLEAFFTNGDIGVVYFYLFALSSVTIITSSLLNLLFFLLIFLRYGSILDGFRAFFIHIGLIWVYTAGWLDSIFSRDLFFERTNKFILPKLPSIIRTTGAEFLIASLSILSAVLFLQKREFLSGFIFVWVAIMFLSVYYVDIRINTTRAYSEGLIRKFKEETSA